MHQGGGHRLSEQCVYQSYGLLWVKREPIVDLYGGSY